MGAMSKMVRKSSSAPADATSADRRSVMSSIWAMTYRAVSSVSRTQDGVDADPDHPAVVVDQARVGSEMVEGAGHEPLHTGADGVAIGRVDHGAQGHPDQVVGRPPDDGGRGGVHPQQEPGRVHQGHAQRGLVEDQLPASSGLPVVEPTRSYRAGRQEIVPGHRPRTNIDTPPIGRRRSLCPSVGDCEWYRQQKRSP